MSLPASSDSPIPEETVRVAHAAFPKGNVFMRMRDALGPIYSNPHHPLPEELGRRVAPHPTQAACRKCKGSYRTPFDRCSKVTFTRLGIQLFP
jgi:hypothetical protein